jgi:hypothetical protein
VQKADKNHRRRGRTWITRKAMHRKNIRSSSEGTDSSSQIQETEQKKRKKAQTKRDSQKKIGARRWKFYHEIAASSELVYNTTKKTTLCRSHTNKLASRGASPTAKPPSSPLKQRPVFRQAGSFPPAPREGATRRPFRGQIYLLRKVFFSTLSIFI